MSYTPISHQLPPSDGVTVIHNKDGSVYMHSDPVYVGKLPEEWSRVDLHQLPRRQERRK